MKPGTQRIIHIGINFVTIPSPVVTKRKSLAFQQAVLTHGLDFTKVENPENRIILKREDPSPLELSVLDNNQFGQVLVISVHPKVPLSLFIEEAEAALGAFESVWPTPTRQIIKSDATIRCLYETTAQHAFQELWESRLGQESESLKAFARPIRGGGLRFVMDPRQDDEQPAQIEVKIESYLRDTSKIFVETVFTWTKPTDQGEGFDVRARLEQIYEYIENQVTDFLSEK